ncbi:MAG TPA: Asp23/Gls24 family envelope stress response protein [Roseiflexaceae bacterium]|nr:Asp23/Gls24 family envelope stress response protein [Roseiflexaceae bacterium]
MATEPAAVRQGDAPQLEAPAGRIEVLPRAIATIAARAACACEGVVALAAPAPGDGGAEALPLAEAHRGVVVHVHGATLTVEAAILVAYGAPIAPVAQAVQGRVWGALERALGQPPASVIIRVQGVR